MGEDLKQRRQQHDDEEEEEDDDEELFDSDSLLSNSDVDEEYYCNGDDGDHELSTTLVEQLPVKRGLSKYYQGKSQSYTSLSAVRTLEDLQKKENPYKRKKMMATTTMMKTCKRSYREVITSRKTPRAASCTALAAEGGKKPPLVHPLRKNSCNSH